MKATAKVSLEVEIEDRYKNLLSKKQKKNIAKKQLRSKVKAKIKNIKVKDYY